MGRLSRAMENLVRWYGRRRIAWRLTVHAIQDARWDGEDLPPEAEIAERAKQIEGRMHQHYFSAPNDKIR